MTLDEAIIHCEEVASRCEADTDWGMGNHFIDRSGVADIIECGKEHRQLAEWLKELKQLREQTRWIPVSERLPKKEMNCLVTDSLGKVHKVTFYHALDGREAYFSGCYCVRAWMPLPTPYEP